MKTFVLNFSHTSLCSHYEILPQFVLSYWEGHFSNTQNESGKSIFKACPWAICICIGINKRGRGLKVFLNCLYSQDTSSIMAMMHILNNFQNNLICLFESLDCSMKIFLKQGNMHLYFIHTYTCKNIWIYRFIYPWANSNPKDMPKWELILRIRSYDYQI